MKHIFIIILIYPFGLLAQNTIGLPDVINYSKQVYKAGTQTWDIKQGKNGIIYAANNEGLLCFDGTDWQLFALPNRTIVRSVEIVNGNRIYVGGQDELGYFSPNFNGSLVYTSLISMIPIKDRQFGDVWDIIQHQQEVLVRTTNKIFKFSGETTTTFEAPLEWSYLGICNGTPYAHDYQKGLLKLQNNSFTPLKINGLFPGNDPVTGILPFGNDSLLICTLKNGLFISDGKEVFKKNSEYDDFFRQARIYASTPLADNSFALATNNEGVFILDKTLSIVQRFSKREGLQNNNVLSVFFDRQGNIWLGLDNGIDFIGYSNAIKEINPAMQDGGGYAVEIFNNMLYLGTSSGLYSTHLQNSKDLSFSRGNFEEVTNSKGQVWRLSVINNQVLMGHHDGAFIINDNRAQRISSQAGFWDFLPLNNIQPTQKILAGHYKGLAFFDFAGNRFTEAGNITGFTESSRYITADNDGNYWVSHPYHGIYRISKNEYGSFTEKMYTHRQGLPSTLNNHIYKIKNEVLAATEKGIYKFNPQKDYFEPHTAYHKIFGDLSIRYLKEDPSGNTWFIHEKQLGLIDYSGRDPSLVFLPELDRKMLSGFEFIYPVDASNTFLGGEKGFYHINFEKYRKHLPALEVLIRNVKISSKTDSLLFGGYLDAANLRLQQEEGERPGLTSNWKTIRFQFSSPLFGNQSNLEYSYQLLNFDAGWSDWSARTEKEYTNLPPGSYSFHVKARNNFGNESTATTYSFSILPAWYATMTAKIIYFFLFTLLIYLLYRLQKRKIQMQQTKYEQEQKKLRYIHELELNKTASELVTLKNDKLEAEINFKNSELASSAMHLVKKGELMAKIKNELHQLMKNISNAQASEEVKKLLKTLNEDEKSDADWDSFAQHFDKVHSDFTIRLKQQIPSITANEMKLCAYLRMNLSTKEIARLMNISVRGVEIGRYRLRKKLALPSDKGLFDYLIQV